MQHQQGIDEEIPVDIHGKTHSDSKEQFHKRTQCAANDFVERRRRSQLVEVGCDAHYHHKGGREYADSSDYSPKWAA